MSIAQGQTTIKFISKSGTFSAYCTCSWGDLYQMYESTSNPNLVPNFGAITNVADKPMIEFHVNSSRLTDTVAIGVPTVKIGNDTLTFGGNNKSLAPYADVFELVSVDAATYGLRVLDDFADKVGFAPFVVTFQSQISVNGQPATESIQAFYNVSVLQGTESDIRVMITETASSGQSLHGFTIREKTDVVSLKAVARQGNDVLTSGLSYQWHEYDAANSQWTAISGETGATLHVTEAMVTTYAAYMVKVTYNSVDYTDMQGVWDAQDPLQMVFDSVPADLTIEEGNSNRQRVYLWPKVLRDGVQDTTYHKFKFAIHGSSGDIVNAGSLTPTNINADVYGNANVLDYAGKSKNGAADANGHYSGVFYVNQAAIQQAGGDVSVTVETVV